jgi:hypothetical protein
VHFLTLGANIAVTLSTANVPDRTTIRLWVTQDGTGLRLVTGWTGVTWLNGITPTLQTTASAYDLIEFSFVNALTTWVGRLLTDYTFAANSGTFGGAVQSTSPTAGVGYGTGAGGTVTQLTNKATGVALNKVTGAITMNNAALNAGVSVTFTVSNSAVLADDVPLVIHKSAGTAGAYRIEACHVQTGASFDVTVTNITGGNLSEAIVLQFSLVRGATS